MREALVSFPLFGRCAEMYNRFNDTGLFSNILFYQENQQEERILCFDKYFNT